MKLNRSYRLTLEVDSGEAIIIEPPFTIRFSVNRTTQSSQNLLNLSIFNLGEKTRNRIFQDRYDYSIYRKIIFEAGYGELSKIFQGNLFEAYSERQGVDIITRITAFDGGFDIYNSLTSRSMEGLSQKEVVNSLIGEFDNIKRGKIGEIEGNFLRPVVLDGNTYELIKLYGGLVYVDLEELNILKNNEVVPAFIPLLNSNTGLLYTPRRRNSLVTVSTMFEPRIILSQVLEIESSISNFFDGQYKVIGLKHDGTISDAIGGTCISSFDLLVESQLFGGFQEVT